MNYYADYRNFQSNDPVFHLPPYQVRQVFRGLSETVDWGLKAFNIPDLWKQSRGKGIRIAVLDTGIDSSHPDLQGAIEEAVDFTGGITGPVDMAGHGTHVAGIIAARRNNLGVAGVAPEARLLIGKVLNDSGFGTFQSIVSGIRWAIDKQVDIISMSLGGRQYDAEMHRALREAVQAGIFIICAAGNDGNAFDTVNFPAFVREAVAVGAINQDGRVTNFSSRGYQVDIMAPGQNILSTVPPQSYGVLDGTSMATPFVTGVVALMLAKHRDLGGQTPIRNQMELIQHLRKTALDAGDPGYDPHYGFGLINPERVLETQEFAGVRRMQNFYPAENLPNYLKNSRPDYFATYQPAFLQESRMAYWTPSLL